jgi:phosphoglycolate phosphatase
MIKMIIYDFDGTIADSLPIMVEAYNRVAREKGFQCITEENLQAIRAQRPRDILKELGVGLHQVPKLLYRVLREVKLISGKIAPCAGMKELLYAAHNSGYRQTILTSNLEDNVREFLLNNEIEIFDSIYCGSATFGKARTLKRLLKETRLTSREVVYVGDEIRDIEATRKIGISIICVGWGYNTREALESHAPHAVIERPEEILSAIQKLQSDRAPGGLSSD